MSVAKPLLFVSLAVAIVPGLASADEAGSLPIVAATIDYSSENSDPADAFFAALDANVGKAIDLKLTLVPDQQSDGPGFTLAATNGEPIVCGQEGMIGSVDNGGATFELSFQHPAHFHAPATIHIGDRLHFPFNSAKCGVEGYIDNRFTPLHVAGQFVVMAADIPTAVTYDLYPYNP